MLRRQIDVKYLTPILAAVLALGIAAPAFPQQAQTTKKYPVKWTLAADPATVAPSGKVLLKLTAQIDPEWHMYSATSPPGAGQPLVLKLENPAVERAAVYQPNPEKKFDSLANVETERYEGTVVFLLEAQLAKNASAGPLELISQIRYSACTDKMCLPPRKVTAATTVTVDAKAAVAAVSIPPGYVAVTAKKPGAPSPGASQQAQPPQELIPFLLTAIAAGFAAIFTPCVFPMIPITLSFFLNRPGATRSETLKQAIVFCLGIISLFTLLGLGLTAVLGPFGVVQLGANPWVNGFIALVFLVFGLSLLGAFEITLPSGLVNTMDRASQKGGIFGTLLMGLTFALTSFACVGPFVGTLLAASVQQGRIQPALGMISFATALSSPFFFLALFPSYLKRLPRSGGWLIRVKVVLGFIVLAAMLKYISAIDQVLQWNFLTRERFLAAWFVLFLLPGLYLLGFLRMEGIDKEEPVGVKRALIGAFFIIFAVSLVPGMFDKPLGELDSYVPLASASNGGPSGQAGLVWMKNDYKAALEKARAENKLVFVNFTGYACTNCHWMKANMFPRPEIAGALKDFVLLELYTDGTDAASEENEKLEDKLFSTVALPFYAIITPDEKIVATWGGVQRDAAQYLAFLQTR
jgi:thiol:disulfide interchange protein